MVPWYGIMIPGKRAWKSPLNLGGMKMQSTRLLVALSLLARQLFALSLGSAPILQSLDPIQSLHEWADRHGAARSVRVGPSRFGGRGLVATDAVVADAPLLSIPLDLTISTHRGTTQDAEHWATRLALKLYHARLEETPPPHVLALPSPPNVPHRWSDSWLHELQNATLAGEAQRWRQLRREQFILACASISEARPARWSEAEFNDLYDLSCSRALGARAERDGGDCDTLRLVPLLDMAQHCPTAGGRFALSRGGEHLTLFAGRRCVEGDECYLDYGRRASDEFLLQYGFVPERNVYDSLSIRVEGARGARELHLSWRDVESASQEVRDACAAMLASMPSTLAEDVSLLEQASEHASSSDESRDASSDGSIPHDVLVTALRYRVGKKQLLRAIAGAPPACAATSAFAVGHNVA